MLSAAFLFTLMSVTVKLLPPNYSVWHIGFIRCFGGLILLLTVFGPGRAFLDGKNTALLSFRGICGTITFLTAVGSLRLLPISTSTVIFYSFPIFAAIFSTLLYKEKMTFPQFCCIILVITGVYILLDFELSGYLPGYLLALTASIFAGLTITLIQSLRKENSPVVIYFYFCLAGSLITVPIFMTHPVLPGSAIEWMMILLILLTSVSAQLLMNQGFFYCKSWEGSVYLSMETVFTSMIGIGLLKDPVSWRFFGGSLLILSSSVFLYHLNRDR